MQHMEGLINGIVTIDMTEFQAFVIPGSFSLHLTNLFFRWFFRANVLIFNLMVIKIFALKNFKINIQNFKININNINRCGRVSSFCYSRFIFPPLDKSGGCPLPRPELLQQLLPLIFFRVEDTVHWQQVVNLRKALVEACILTKFTILKKMKKNLIQ